jgi:hypothetical protein
MAEVIVIEFSAPNAVNIYNEVNRILGWEGVPDSEHWPAGMLSHVAGSSGDKLLVLEVWESKSAQEEFMQSQLGPAFAQAKVPDPTRIEWFNNVADAHHH